MSTHTELAVIPQPKPDPILGNIRDLDPKGPVQSMIRLAHTYGPIYRLSLPGGDVIFIGSQELSDETRFEKGENQAIENLREVITWLYNSTKRSVLIVMVLHLMMNVSGEFFAPLFSGEAALNFTWLKSGLFSLVAISTM